MESNAVITSSGAPWPYFAEDEIEAAMRVLRSGKVNYWTGQEGQQFEEEFAAFSGCKHAVALANGTVALECALKALGIGPGDEVVTTSRTFIASASCAVMLGARPVFADVDRESQNITAESIRNVLTPRTKAIVAVHLAGWPCEMDDIVALARERGIKVVEDCAQAHGATYKGRPIGSLGDVAAFSFCQDKIMTTAGEGGMVTTNSKELWNAMWSLKDHGKSYDAVYPIARIAPGFRWLHESFGTNWRLTEIQSAIGRLQLRKLPIWVEKRRKHAAMLTRVSPNCQDCGLLCPPNILATPITSIMHLSVPTHFAQAGTGIAFSRRLLREGFRVFLGVVAKSIWKRHFPSSGGQRADCRSPVNWGRRALCFWFTQLSRMRILLGSAR